MQLFIAACMSSLFSCDIPQNAAPYPLCVPRHSRYIFNGYTAAIYEPRFRESGHDGYIFNGYTAAIYGALYIHTDILKKC